MPVCKRVLYRGHVQGVGFRYTAYQVAKRYAVSGQVRNLPNGEVELIAEGEAAEVERFLAALAERMVNHIADHSMNDEAPRGFAGFEIVG
jgi:acylphosphatase